MEGGLGVGLGVSGGFVEVLWVRVGGWGGCGGGLGREWGGCKGEWGGVVEVLPGGPSSSRGVSWESVEPDLLPSKVQPPTLRLAGSVKDPDIIHGTTMLERKVKVNN